MSDSLVIDKGMLETASGLLGTILKDLKHQPDGADTAMLKTMGLNAIFTTRDLMFAPMTLAVFEMMGQNGMKNLMYHGGYYAAERFSIESVGAGYATWDESLINYYGTIGLATGWGVYLHPEIDLNPENPRVVCLLKNHPSSTTVVRIMESAAEKNPGLKIDYKQTFCDYQVGWLVSMLRLIMKEKGTDEKVISAIKGKEEYCQAQKGNDHCRIVVSLLDR
jgi:hypothetical protein